MTENLLESLKTTDTTLLTNVVRQDQQSPTFEILNWTVKRLSDKGVANPDGLFLYSGTGQDERGSRDWSVVLKILKNDDDKQVPISSFWYAKREVLAIEAGLLSDLPGPVAVPRIYGVMPHEQQIRVWMEYIVEAEPSIWGIDQYTFAAHELGYFNGAYLAGRSLPDFPWLSKETARDWTHTFPLEPAWENRYVKHRYSPTLREQVTRLWDDQERFLVWLTRLPQTFSHFDFHRRNLIIRQKTADMKQVVALDWALCDNGPIGGDLGMLVGMSANMGELEVDILPEIEAAAFEAYCNGLQEAGWTGDTRQVRLGYAVSLIMFAGITSPIITASWLPDDQAPPSLENLESRELQAARHWAAVCAFALTRADECYQLANQIF